MADSHRPFCIYAISQSGKDVISVAGTIWPTRAETVGYLKAKPSLARLSAVDDGRFRFTIDGLEVDDEPRVWANSVDDLPVKPKPTIHLEILDKPVEVKEEGDVNAKTLDLLVYFEYRSLAGRELNAYPRTVHPDQQTRGVLAGAAAIFGRDAGDLVFSLDDRVLQGNATCAEAGLFAGARIIATDKEGRNPNNAAAGSSTGPGTRRTASTSSVDGATEAADDHDPPADHPPRPSAPTDESTADQRPVSGPSARQQLPATSSATPAAPNADIDRGGRVRADDEACDGNAGGSSPGDNYPPTRKKAKVVKEKEAKPAAAKERKSTTSEEAVDPSGIPKKGKQKSGKAAGEGSGIAVMASQIAASDIVEDEPAQPRAPVKKAAGMTSASTRKRHQPPGARPRSRAAAQSTSSSKGDDFGSGGPSTARRASGEADDEPAWHSSLPTPARSTTSSGRSHDCDDANVDGPAACHPPAPKYAAKFETTTVAGKGKEKGKKRPLAQDDNDDYAPPPPTRDVTDADEDEAVDQPVVQAGSTKKKARKVVDSDDDDEYGEVLVLSPEPSRLSSRQTRSTNGRVTGSVKGSPTHAADGAGLSGPDDRLIRMYISPPRPMDLSRKVVISKDWGLRTYEKGGSLNGHDKGRMTVTRGSTRADWTPNEWRYTELNLEPVVPLPLPAGPRPVGDVVPFEQDLAPFNYPSTVLLSRERIAIYLRKTLLALGMPDLDLDTLPILPVNPSLTTSYSHVLLRFVPQAACASAVKIELNPPAGVETRIFYIYQGLTADQAAHRKWENAMDRAEEDVAGWREILDVPAEEEQNDASLMRLCECGGMEIIGR